MSLAQSLANIIQNEAYNRGQLGIQAAGIIPNAIAQGADTLQGALNQMAANKTLGLQQAQMKRMGELQELQLSKAKRDEQNDAEIRAILKSIPDGPNATQQRAQAFVQFWQTRDPEKALAIRNSLRGEAIQAATLMEGKPGRTPVQAGVEAQLPATATSPVVPLEHQQVAHEPITIPGVLGPDITVQPSTAQELQQRKLAEKLGEAQIKGVEPFTLGANQVRFQGGTRVAAGPVTPTRAAGTGLVKNFDIGDGRGVRSWQFNPATGKYDIDLGKPQPPPSLLPGMGQYVGQQGGEAVIFQPTRGGGKMGTVPLPSEAPIQPRTEPADIRTKRTAFATAAPVIDSISSLSEKINTQQGVMAKLSGEAEKAKAQINLNDDVAEYESIISGFTPLVARAVGHSGVLTEQDVQSVRKMFPAPGDSKSLRDRKVARLKSIMGGVQEAVGNVGGGKSGAAPKVGDTKKFPNGNTGVWDGTGWVKQ